MFSNIQIIILVVVLLVVIALLVWRWRSTAKKVTILEEELRLLRHANTTPLPPPPAPEDDLPIGDIDSMPPVQPSAVFPSAQISHRPEESRLPDGLPPAPAQAAQHAQAAQPTPTLTQPDIPTESSTPFKQLSSMPPRLPKRTVLKASISAPPVIGAAKLHRKPAKVNADHDGFIVSTAEAAPAPEPPVEKPASAAVDIYDVDDVDDDDDGNVEGDDLDAEGPSLVVQPVATALHTMLEEDGEGEVEVEEGEVKEEDQKEIEKAEEEVKPTPAATKSSRSTRRRKH